MATAKIRQYVPIERGQSLEEPPAPVGDGTELASSGGACVGCGRIMSVRERNEQGVCNDCAEGTS